MNTSVTPDSDGATEASALQGGANAGHLSDPRFDTADFADGAIGAARLLACPSTGERYPPASMRLGEQGTVEVSAAVGADGRVTGEAGQPVHGVVQLRLRWALEP